MTAAFITCFVALVIIYWVAHPVVSELGIWWAEGLAYAAIPITATFTILYRSRWHQEVAGGRRTGSLLLISCVIFGGVLLALAAMIPLVWFCAIAIRVCAGGR